MSQSQIRGGGRDPISPNRLHFDAAIFEEILPDFTACAKMVMMILRHLANATRLSVPPGFDAAGNYTGRL
jgi:hypothetical protein